MLPLFLKDFNEDLIKSKEKKPELKPIIAVKKLAFGKNKSNGLTL